MNDAPFELEQHPDMLIGLEMPQLFFGVRAAVTGCGCGLRLFDHCYHFPRYVQ